MKKIFLVAACSLLSMSCYATVFRITSYDQLLNSLETGYDMKIDLDQSKCTGVSFPVKSYFKPHAEMIASGSILASDSVVTDQNPSVTKGSLVREQVDYTIMPKGTSGALKCTSDAGCVFLAATVYKYSDGSVIKSFPTVTCPIGSGAVFLMTG